MSPGDGAQDDANAQAGDQGFSDNPFGIEIETAEVRNPKQRLQMILHIGSTFTCMGKGP
jgi:hypothetical protein